MDVLKAATTRHTTTGHPSVTAARPAWSTYLAECRIKRGLTVTEAAAHMGVTPQTWTGLETGTRPSRHGRRPIIPRDETLLRIADALGLNDDELRRLRALVAQLAPPRQVALWQQQLREARLAARMTLTEAARHAGVTVATYSAWERGRRRTINRHALRRLLPHLGITGDSIDEFLRLIPPQRRDARPPTQPSKPIKRVPAWSQLITNRRLAAGLNLSQVDALLGQPSVARRFELGGWPRADGRLSVPPTAWLDRIADVLAMSDDDRRELHRLADQERLALAASGPGPLPAGIMHEARRAAGLTQQEAEQAVGGLPHRWAAYEHAHRGALASLRDPALVDRLVTRLPMQPLLAAALRAAVLT